MASSSASACYPSHDDANVCFDTDSIHYCQKPRDNFSTGRTRVLSFSQTFRPLYPIIKPKPVKKAPKKRIRDADESKNAVEVFNSPYKRLKPSFIEYDEPIAHRKSTSFTVKAKEMQAFFKLMLVDDVILDFLARDSCRRISDKYLLAMTFAYFKRATFTLREYNRMNFFIALYLANDMEEDEEDYKYEIFPWALGRNWRKRYPSFLLKRDRLWMRIGYRAVVSKKCCEEVMAIEPDHSAWKRERPEHHGGAYRDYLRVSDDDLYPRGPYRSPNICKLCDDMLEYDSAASVGSESWFVSSGASSESSSPGVICVIPQSSFDMQGLGLTLPGNHVIWPTALNSDSVSWSKGDDENIWARGCEE